MALDSTKPRRNQSGFTIVELLVVIVVIAVLAAITVVAYTGIQERGRSSTAFGIASQVAKKAEVQFAVANSYPTTAANFTADSSLEAIKVTIGITGQPATPFAAATFNSIASAQTEFLNGSRVIYVGNASGYTITYRTSPTASATITKGTPPSGTYAFSSNEN